MRLDPDMKPVPEKEGYEFGYSCFEELPPAEVFNVDEVVTKEVKLHSDTDIAIPEVECTLLVPTAKLRSLQLKDTLCQKRAKQVNTNTDTSKSYYGNNMKKDILRHCKHCAVCEKFKTKHIKFEKLHFSSPGQPMEFISMDLIGEFYPPTSKGHHYALTVMDMLTGFVFCAPLKSKKAEEIAQAYLNKVYYRVGGSRKILSDNGTKFKNKVFEEVSRKLRCEVRAYSPPY